MRVLKSYRLWARLKQKTDSEVESLIRDLAGVMEDNWSYKSEAEKMAKEIDQSFEELYLYSKIATQVKDLRFTETMHKELIEELLTIMRVDLAFAELKKHEEYSVLAERPDIANRVSDPRSFLISLLNSIPEDSVTLKDSYFIINNSKEHHAYAELHPQPFRFLAVKMRNNLDLHGWLGLYPLTWKSCLDKVS